MSDKCACGIEVELDLAAHVQQLLFPKSSPLCNWCGIGTKNRMASSLGGDYFDFITMPDRSQAIFIGDVTGHGLHASVVMSLLYGYIHRAAGEACSASEVVEQANEFLQTFATRSREFDHFFSSSLFFGIIDPGTLEMVYVNAGHPMPMIRRGGEILTLPPTGSLIGFFDDPEFGMQTCSFREGDRFLLYTDGVLEAPGRGGERFGLERLKDVLLHKDHDHNSFLDELFLSLQEFGASDPPEDDCTAIVVDFHPPLPA